MGITNCPFCGAYYPNHAITCPIQGKDNGPGGNPIPLLVAPFVVLAIPFVVVVFPIASTITIFAAMGINWVIRQGVQDNAAFWLTLFVAIIPFLAALNVEHWAERFRGYRIARHLLRVVGVPCFAAQYLLYLPGLIGPAHRAPNYTVLQFVGQVLARPGVLGTVIVLAVLAHWVGSSFDLSGRRPASWAQFFRPRRGVFSQPEPTVPLPGAGATPKMSRARAPMTLSRKLLIATALGFAVGVATTLVGSDYDSALMVIVRVGLLCALVFTAIVGAHHALVRKGSAPIPKR
ncbi:MAG TPA: hypothetical protein VH328_03530 [Burkholderiaceae bacterium]|nr:hypothetical protein [Burkholderiaceae bacterium]